MTTKAPTAARARVAADIYTAIVIATVAMAAAALTWRLQGYAGVDPAAAPAAPGIVANTDIGPLIALAPFGRVSAQAQQVTGPTDLVLKAIFAANPAAASTVLIAGPDGQTNSYRIGEQVGDGTIESILPFAVTLRTATGTRRLSFDEDEGAQAGQPGGAPRPNPAPGSSAAPAPAYTPPPAPTPDAVASIRALIPGASPPAGAPPAPPPPSPRPSLQ